MNMTSTDSIASDSNGTPAGVSTFTPGTAPSGYRWFIQPYRLKLQAEARSHRYRTDNGPVTNQGCPEVRGLVIPRLGPVLVTGGRVSVKGAPRTHYDRPIADVRVLGALPDAPTPEKFSGGYSPETAIPCGRGGMISTYGDWVAVSVEVTFPGLDVNDAAHPAYPLFRERWVMRPAY